MAGEMTDYLKVTFWQGLEANLPSTKVGGRLYYATDTKTIYLDNNKERYQFKCADPVTSVNGKTGSVNLDYSDVNALSNSTTYAGSTSVGGPATYTNGIHYGTVDSTSTSTAFTATVNGITSLYDGVTVMLKNGVVTSASGFTININNLGAKPVYSNMATGHDTTDPTRDTTIFNINYTMLLVYSTNIVSGGGWICYRGYDANTNTIGYQLRTNATVMSVTDTARYYKMYFMNADSTGWVPASVNSTNNATTARPVNQRPINPFGRIVYTSASTNYTAGANLAATSIWDQYTLVLGYSFNNTGEALNMTVEKPVYLKCAPQTNGSAIMDVDNPIVQSLPSSADGKIYIYLGVAYDATHLELVVNHPVYYHDGTGIKLWGGSDIPTKTSDLTNDSGYITSYTDTKNTAGSTNTSSKIFLIGATSQAANPQTYSHDTAYVGTDGKLYSASKVVLVGGSNASSSVTITPTTTDVYSMTSAGSVTPGTAASYTQGTFSKGTLPTMTWAMDATDTKQLNITFSQGTLPSHASDTFTANTPTAVTLPGRSSSAIKAWTGYSSATAAAQVFTGTTG